MTRSGSVRLIRISISVSLSTQYGRYALRQKNSAIISHGLPVRSAPQSVFPGIACPCSGSCINMALQPRFLPVPHRDPITYHERSTGHARCHIVWPVRGLRIGALSSDKESINIIVLPSCGSIGASWTVSGQNFRSWQEYPNRPGS